MSKKSLVGVKVKNNDINKALKIFKKRVMESGHLLELRERQEYKKPKTIRREEKLNAIREQKRQNILEKILDGDNTLKLSNRKKKRKNVQKKSEKKKELSSKDLFK